jgi:hypothetical protein
MSLFELRERERKLIRTGGKSTVKSFTVFAPHYIIESRRLEMGGGKWHL